MPLRSSLCGFAVLLVACSAGGAPAVQDGDIIFQTSRSSQSLAIQRATHSPYSHMGIILYRSGRPFVFEAIATVRDRKSTRLNSSHITISYAVSCLKKKKKVHLSISIASFEFV